MEEVIIYYTDEVIDYLDNLVYILYKEEYFSYRENSHNYVLNIYTFADNNVILPNVRKTPISLKIRRVLYLLSV